MLRIHGRLIDDYLEEVFRLEIPEYIVLGSL
jgi:hypothetical protein